MSAEASLRKPKTAACAACHRPCNRCLKGGFECIPAPDRRRKRNKVGHSYPEAQFQLFEPEYSSTHLDQIDTILAMLDPRNDVTASPPSDEKETSRNVVESSCMPASLEFFDEVIADDTIQKLSRLGLTDAGAAMAPTFKAYTEKVAQLRSWVTPEQREDMRLQAERERITFVQASNALEFPCVIFERLGIIWHVNDAFRRETGWNAETPTKIEDNAIFQLLESETLHLLYYHFPRVFMSGIRRFAMRGSFKKYGTEEEDYVEGLLSLTIRRDVFGLAYLFFLQFVPDHTIEEPLSDTGALTSLLTATRIYITPRLGANSDILICRLTSEAPSHNCRHQNTDRQRNTPPNRNMSTSVYLNLAGVVPAAYFFFSNLGTSFFGALPVGDTLKVSALTRLQIWEGFFDLAKLHMPTSSHIAGLLLGASAYYAEHAERRYALIAASIPLSLMVPWTAAVMLPGINKMKLILSAKDEQKAESEGLELIRQWRTQHSVRTFFGFMGFGLSFYALGLSALHHRA
ncbi:hypothetical protein PROFUN_03498 [Planoprotostelium fungivorum]|uniref:Uncharacterized protein n=1 Tax=Planoprotostelium fungivorum TaxID=1890364 RepID=A0A2P6MN90_9EUKA|nr:hypothetical protein PROFUN_03498 [Planoprotostelium fungivorum]